jgi:poly-gamma-glutamate synthesis protein (capsule biosynthesis protein)
MQLLFTGDFCFNGQFAARLHAGEAIFSPSVQAFMQQQDACIANLEGAILSEDLVQKHLPKIWNPSAATARLNSLGITHCTLANNHSFDAGTEGFQATKDALEAAGIESFGAGNSLAEATAPVFLESDAGRIALIGASFREGKLASRQGAGVFCPSSEKFLLAQFKAAREQAEHLIFCYHGEEEYTRHPLPRRRKWLHRLARTGLLTAIVCHHPHVLQGWEEVAGVPIYYSLGNTVFDVPSHHHRSFTDQGALLQVELTDQGLQHQWRLLQLNRQAGTIDWLEEAGQEAEIQALSDFSQAKRSWQAEAFRAFREERFRAPATATTTTPATAPPPPPPTSFLRKLLRLSFYRSLFATLRYPNSRAIFLAALAHFFRQKLPF